MLPSYDKTRPNQLNGKVVFAGPRGSGKSATLEGFSRVPLIKARGALLRLDMRQRMVTLEGDQLSIQSVDIDVPQMAFSYEMQPFDFGEVGSHSVSANCYAFPGHPAAHEAIDRAWRGIDVLIFVADGRAAALEENTNSWTRVRTNGWVIEAKPKLVLQINRSDAAGLVAPEDLMAALAWPTRTFFATVASTGEGLAAVAQEAQRLLKQSAVALVDQVK